MAQIYLRYYLLGGKNYTVALPLEQGFAFLHSLQLLKKGAWFF
jgi:hypothetical protein